MWKNTCPGSQYPCGLQSIVYNIMPAKKLAIYIAIALFCTYFIWGSTYLAQRFAIESFPSFLMAGSRAVAAGALMYAILWLRGHAHPKPAEWLGAGVVGFLLIAIGSGTVAYVQQTVSSSVAALSIATVPIWMAIFSSFWGHHPSKREWLGILVGFIGIVLLNFGGSLHGNISSALLLMLAAAGWSLGSIWGKHLAMPKGLMGAACQMLLGGLILLVFSHFQGETWPSEISQKSWGALVFLVIFGSMIAYSAYQYLLKTVRPLVASSNTFVNPVVAFAAGIWFAGETVTGIEYAALAVILVGVFLVLTADNEEIEKLN
jgi:drug/metabolite transporter (DMT)-like permease